MNDDNAFSIIAAVIVAVVLVAAGFAVHYDAKIRANCPPRHVVEIGVCSSGGLGGGGVCAVRYDDGSTGRAYLPMVGDKAEPKDCL